MATKRQREIAPSDDERQMELMFASALADEKDRHFVQEIGTLMRVRGLFALGVSEFLALIKSDQVERPQWSRLLTRLALHNADALLENREMTEATVAHFGRFLAPLTQVAPDVALAWAQDIGDGDPDEGGIPRQEVQPTAFIRGVFFSRSIPHPERGKFWSVAALSSRFPMRIFSDPCLWCEGVILSTYHQRVIADICAGVTDDALVAICERIRDHAVTRAVREQAPTAENSEAWRVKVVEADLGDRKTLWDQLATTVTDTARRPLMRQTFGI